MFLTTSSRGGRYGLLAATDRRVLILRGQDESEDIAYRNVTAFESGRERRKPFIRFRTEAGEIVVRGLGRNADEICRHIHARMWDVSYQPHIQRPTLTVVPAANVA
jgi:hypothetical protein